MNILREQLSILSTNRDRNIDHDHDMTDTNMKPRTAKVSRISLRDIEDRSDARFGTRITPNRGVEGITQ